MDPMGPNNRIWLAWDDSEVDVEVLFVFNQCIHCRVVARLTHEYSFITIVYGSNDLAGRRELWGHLLTLMEEVRDEPWLVLGDFNTVLDSSKVCGNSGDITSAIDEFRTCIMDTGLLDVPLRGQFTRGIIVVMNLAVCGRNLTEC
ncbi:UNVERIFIED_CONTAM: hypothetical protein Slati_2779700 [Sesamum latifolium]|uniref:Uncharacterized protein n=1 Tax=Sesamum latifolium TaxID=2727402 RepID=A0AAW2VXM1_9LAMI